MPAEFKNALRNPSPTLFQDFAGCAALVVIFLTALHLPGLI